MKRKLIQQILHDWRSNVWIVVELIITAVALWQVFVAFSFIAERRMQYHGYDTDNVYVMAVNRIPSDHEAWVAPDSTEAPDAGLQRLAAQYRENPYVEEVGLASNGTPYGFNFWGAMYQHTAPDTTHYIRVNVRYMTPEAIRVYHIQGLNGESPEQIAAVIERGEIVLSNFDADFSDTEPTENFIGKDMLIGGDSSKVVRVGAVAYGLRRSDYEPLYQPVSYFPLSYLGEAQEMLVRVKPGMGSKFVESLTPEAMREGNWYLTNLTSMSERARTAHSSTHATMRMMGIFSLFLGLVVFLGFLGTFWLRTQQRVGEIALRKVCGASNWQICRRIISEGLLLLLCALPVIAALVYALFDIVTVNLVVNIQQSPTAIIAGTVATAVFMVLIIVGAILFPARKAMQVDPATAIKEL